MALARLRMRSGSRRIASASHRPAAPELCSTDTFMARTSARNSWPRSPRAIVAGIHTFFAERKTDVSGITPITRAGCALTRISRPTIFGSARIAPATDPRQQHHLRRAGLLVGGSEIPAEHRRDAERREQVGGYRCTGVPLRAFAVAQVDSALTVGRNVGMRGQRIAPAHHLVAVERVELLAVGRLVVVDQAGVEQALRLRERQRPHDQSVDHTGDEQHAPKPVPARQSPAARTKTRKQPAPCAVEFLQDHGDFPSSTQS